ncbi:hypothetical protein MKW92_010259 [Papaver armeniacum]|nr:hypothetical protein MKW92_010259 [Papaver armeniacum]
MAFWGVELKAGKTYIHKYDSSLGRLRITQAILGYKVYQNMENVIVQCKIGEKSPISVCLLSFENGGACSLDIQFEEKEDDVVLENTGRINVHLSGYYIRNNGQSGNVGSHGVLNVSEMGENLEYKDTEVNGRNIRTMASGSVIEEIKTSRNPKIASHGRGGARNLAMWRQKLLRVEIYYFGQIKSTGYIFESNYADHYKRFRMGNGDVIKGLEVGINGMHVGDKRRITIPPSMGYCGSKARSDVPADAWLVFEVDLKDV